MSYTKEQLYAELESHTDLVEYAREICLDAPLLLAEADVALNNADVRAVSSAFRNGQGNGASWTAFTNKATPLSWIRTAMFFARFITVGQILLMVQYPCFDARGFQAIYAGVSASGATSGTISTGSAWPNLVDGAQCPPIPSKSCQLLYMKILKSERSALTVSTSPNYNPTPDTPEKRAECGIGACPLLRAYDVAALIASSSSSYLADMQIAASDLALLAETAFNANQHLLDAAEALSGGALSINVSYTGLGDNGMTILGFYVHESSTLQQLYVAGNNIDEAGAVGLVVSVSSHPTLQLLDASYNPLSEASVSMLLNEVQVNEVLLVVLLEGVVWVPTDPGDGDGSGSGDGSDGIDLGDQEDLTILFSNPSITPSHILFSVGVRGFFAEEHPPPERILHVVSVSDQCYLPVVGSTNVYRFDSTQLGGGSLCTNLPDDFETGSRWLGVNTAAMSDNAASTALVFALSSRAYPANSTYASGDTLGDSVHYPRRENSSVGVADVYTALDLGAAFSTSVDLGFYGAEFRFHADMESLLACSRQRSFSEKTVVVENAAGSNRLTKYSIPLSATILAPDRAVPGVWTQLACQHMMYNIYSDSTFTISTTSSAVVSIVDAHLRRVDIQTGTIAQCTSGVEDAYRTDLLQPLKSFPSFVGAAYPTPGQSVHYTQSQVCAAQGQTAMRLRITLVLRVPVAKSSSHGDVGILPPNFVPRVDDPSRPQTHTMWPAQVRAVATNCYGLNMSHAPDTTGVEYMGEETVSGEQLNVFSVSYSTAYIPVGRYDDKPISRDDFMAGVFTSAGGSGTSNTTCLPSRFDLVVPLYKYVTPMQSWSHGLASGLHTLFVPYDSVTVNVLFSTTVNPIETVDATDDAYTVSGETFTSPLAQNAEESIITPVGDEGVAHGDLLGMAFVGTGTFAGDASDMFVEQVQVGVVNPSSPYASWVDPATRPSAPPLPSGLQDYNLHDVCDRGTWTNALASVGAPDSHNPFHKTHTYVSNFHKNPAPYSGVPPSTSVYTTTALCRYDVSSAWQKARVGTADFFCGPSGLGSARCDGDLTSALPLPATLFSLVEPTSMWPDGAFRPGERARRAQDAYFIPTWGLDPNQAIVVCTRLFLYQCLNRKPGSSRRLLSLHGLSHTHVSGGNLRRLLQQDASHTDVQLSTSAETSASSSFVIQESAFSQSTTMDGTTTGGSGGGTHISITTNSAGSIGWNELIFLGVVVCVVCVVLFVIVRSSRSGRSPPTVYLYVPGADKADSRPQGQTVSRLASDVVLGPDM